MKKFILNYHWCKLLIFNDFVWSFDLKADFWVMPLGGGCVGVRLISGSYHKTFRHRASRGAVATWDEAPGSRGASAPFLRFWDGRRWSRSLTGARTKMAPWKVGFSLLRAVFLSLSLVFCVALNYWTDIFGSDIEGSFLCFPLKAWVLCWDIFSKSCAVSECLTAQCGVLFQRSRFRQSCTCDAKRGKFSIQVTFFVCDLNI